MQSGDVRTTPPPTLPLEPYHWGQTLFRHSLAEYLYGRQGRADGISTQRSQRFLTQSPQRLQGASSTASKLQPSRTVAVASSAKKGGRSSDSPAIRLIVTFSNRMPSACRR